MRSKVDETISKFVQELRDSYPDVVVELLEGRPPVVDAQLRIECTSHEQIDHVSETVAHLTTKYYLDEGVYIQASATYTGPFL